MACRLDADLDVAACWSQVAREIADFVRRASVSPRDTVVLLPFAQHLPLARGAWLQLDDAPWMPRFETTQTLARSLGPPTAAVPGALAFDPVADPLHADQLLREHVGDWPRRDARGYALALARVVEAAQALARARLAQPPAQRAAWLDRARAALAGAGGPDASERALARVALEWSASADGAAADALHGLAPAAWVAVQVGAVDPLVEALLDAAASPVLRIVADRPWPPEHAGALVVAEGLDFEDEAQRTAAHVLVHVDRGELPVALVALDRVLVRRVRALLERQQVAVVDETGWKLSTTRAGATVAGLLRAVQPQAAADDLLDWLASSPRAWPGREALDAAWRRGAVVRLSQVDGAALDGAALQLWQDWLVLAEPLRAARRVPLDDWLQRLRDALERAALWTALESDAAGVQVLDALRCRGTPAPGSAWARQAGRATFDLAGFRRWLEEVLEAVPFAPPQPPGDGRAPVVITPLARVPLRPFAAVVCPGADAARLGAPGASPALLGDALCATLGLPTAAQRRADERQAFVQLLRLPRAVVLHRRQDGTEPLQPSPLLEQLRYVARRRGHGLAGAADPRVARSVAPRPLRPPQPRAADLLPASLSATGYEALRVCPYRFFAQQMLRLGEIDELDEGVDARDYGTWLHAVLQAFHRQRDGTRPEHDLALLRAVAEAEQQRLAGDAADFLPFAVWFEDLAPRYLAWLHGDEARGTQVVDTELALQAAPERLAPVALGLHGRLDRLDAQPAAAGQRAWRIVDYKTGSTARLRERLRDPLEDTQLPFYAALLESARGAPPGGIEAAYLALDGRDGVVLLPHPAATESADVLLDGLQADYARLRAGAALPALGHGTACEHCNARGLCRRDHWAELPQ